MKLQWSHTVINVTDMEKMLEFYTSVMGFTLTDRGPMMGPGTPEIVFMSQAEDEHHQIAMVQADTEFLSTSLNHLSFRVDAFADVKEMHSRLTERNVKIMPVSHGNTLSLYFWDPENNGLEVFLDTPWHVKQPAGIQWDPSATEEEALALVEDGFKDDPSFVLRDDCELPYFNRTRSH